MIGGVEMVQLLPSFLLPLCYSSPTEASDLIGINSGISFSAVNIGGTICHRDRGAIIRTDKDKK